MIMVKGRKREQWDMTACLRHTIMQCGMAKFNHLPKPYEMNPIRMADGEVMEDEDIFSSTSTLMARALSD